MASSPSSSTPPETATLSEGSVDVEQHHEAAALTVADVNYANAQRGDHATNNNNNNTASISTDGEGANSRNNNNPQPPPPLYRFVMTGGPCGGKTTALARVFSFLRERGFEVISCPEAFTLLRSNGLSVDYFSTPGIDYYIQGAVLDAQTTLENGVARVLQARGNPAVILCDRGTMDGKVYMDEHKFAQIMAERHTNMVQLRDERYDAIFHLVTCADGAVQHYTLENNKARTETAQEAIAVDRKTQRAWVGHPHLYVLDNSTDFEGKMQRLVDIICKIVGLPSRLQRRSAKFLLQQSKPLMKDNLSNVFPPDVDYQVFEVEKAYLLQNPDSIDSNQGDDDENDKTKIRSRKENYSFIRRRTNVDKDTGKLLGSVYQLTTVHQKTATPGAGGTTEHHQSHHHTIIEQKRIISEREYNAAYLARDPTRHVVKQRRVSFLYKHQSFVIHMYQQPVRNLSILHAQVEAARKNNNNNDWNRASSASSSGELESSASSSDAAATNDGEPEVDLPPFLHVERRLSNTKEDEGQYGAYAISLMKRNEDY